MFKAVRLFVIICLPIFLVACGEGNGNGTGKYYNSPYPSPTPSQKTPHVQHNEPLFPSAHVHCQEPGKACSPSVAMLLMKQDNGDISKCTGFLLDNNIFVTNDHCLPTSLGNNSDCSLRGEVVFPEVVGHGSEKIRCSRMVWRSNDSRNQNPIAIDTAFLVLEKTSQRPHLQFSQRGAEHGELVTIEKVDPVPHTYSGVLRKSTCRVIHNTTLIPTFNGRSSVGFIVTGAGTDACEIVSGNSGSPVISGQNQAIAIVRQSNRANSGHPLFRQLLEEYAKSAGLSVKPFAIATNFACVKHPKQESLVTPTECSESMNQAYQQAKANEQSMELAKHYANEFDKLAGTWGNQYYPMFQWKMGVIDRGLIFSDEVYIPVPHCVRPSGGVLTPEVSQNTSGFWAKTYQNRVTWPFYRLKAGGLDDDLKLKMELRALQVTEQFNFEFDVTAATNGQETQLRISRPNSIVHGNVINEKLKPCSH